MQAIKEHHRSMLVETRRERTCGRGSALGVDRLRLRHEEHAMPRATEPRAPIQILEVQPEALVESANGLEALPTHRHEGTGDRLDFDCRVGKRRASVVESPSRSVKAKPSRDRLPTRGQVATSPLLLASAGIDHESADEPCVGPRLQHFQDRRDRSGRHHAVGIHDRHHRRRGSSQPEIHSRCEASVARYQDQLDSSALQGPQPLSVLGAACVVDDHDASDLGLGKQRGHGLEDQIAAVAGDYHRLGATRGNLQFDDVSDRPAIGLPKFLARTGRLRQASAAIFRSTYWRIPPCR